MKAEERVEALEARAEELLELLPPGRIGALEARVDELEEIVLGLRAGLEAAVAALSTPAVMAATWEREGPG